MTAAHDWLHPPAEGWSTDDLDTLPEDNYRRELVDGVLHLSPSQTRNHQNLVGRLTARLYDMCPDDHDVTHGVEVRINRFNSLTPDVLVTTAEAAGRNPSRYRPHEVVIAIEIVSPSSKITDRATKPAMYAEAGIPWYWRIETEPALAVHTYRLDPVRGVYEATDTHTDVLRVAEPWALELPLTAVTPR